MPLCWRAGKDLRCLTQGPGNLVYHVTHRCGSAGEFGSAVSALRTIVQREGTAGLFAGYGSFLLRDLPFDAIEFVAYEQIKKAYQVSSSVSACHLPCLAFCLLDPSI